MSVSKFLLALLFIGIGVAFLLSNFGVIDIDVGDLFSTYWPVFVIWIGLSMIVSAFKFRRGHWDVSGGGIFIGAIILLLGWNFLAKNLGWMTIDFGLIWNLFWPLLLIYIGFKILFRKSGKAFEIRVTTDDEKENKEIEPEVLSPNTVEHIHVKKKRKRKYKGVFIGDINLGKDLYEFEDLHLWNGIGNVRLDLTRAILPEEESRILINGWVGDVDIIVPKDIPVFAEAQVRIGEVRLFDHREGGMMLSGNTYKSPDFDDAVKRIRIVIELKIGDVRVIDR